MAIRVIFAGIFGGLLFFMWSAAAHMATPLGEMGVSSLPDEAPVLSVMRDGITEDGLYFFPGGDMHGDMTEEEMADWEQRLRDGPSGILVVHPDGSEPMSANMLLTELGCNIAATLLAAFIVSRTATGFAGRWLVVALLGPIAWLSITASYWNWYGFPREYVTGEFIMEAVGWLVAGFVIALVLRPRRRDAEVESPGYVQPA